MNDGRHNHDGTVNSRIVDSVASVVTLNTGQAPSQAFGMLDAVMVESLGMAMHNAVMRQQGASMVGNAAVTAACAKMLQRSETVLFSLPPDPPPVGVEPLPGPHDPSPPVAIDEAFAEGEAAVEALRQYAASSTSYASLAEQDLAQLATDASAPLPPPPPPPDPFAAELAEGEAAIAALKKAIAAGGANAAQATADLQKLAADAAAAPKAATRAVPRTAPKTVAAARSKKPAATRTTPARRRPAKAKQS